MTTHLQNEIEKLKKKMLFLGAMVEESLQKAVKAALQRDAKLAYDVVTNDVEIDKMEVELEEECLKVLALYQPVAVDLRYIVAILKINNDLERIGDLAVNMAQRAQNLAAKPKITLPVDLPAMAEEVRIMLKGALDALVNLDSVLANQVCIADDKVDAMNRQTFQSAMTAIGRDAENVESYINLLSVSRYLERVADHATNIAQDVLYLLQGEIVRHRFASARAKTE